MFFEIKIRPFVPRNEIEDLWQNFKSEAHQWDSPPNLSDLRDFYKNKTNPNEPDLLASHMWTKIRTTLNALNIWLHNAKGYLYEGHSLNVALPPKSYVEAISPKQI